VGAGIVMSGATCRLAYGPADATATHSLASVKTDFAFLVPAHLGSPGKGLLNVCVCQYINLITKFTYWTRLLDLL